VSIESLLLIGSLLILFSIGVARALNNFGVPTLILFMVVGMVAGENGLGGIHFDDYGLTKSVGYVALIIILFSGGLDTAWKAVRPIAWSGLSLSTFGVAATMLPVALFARYVLDFTWLMSLLLGAIISSTDAAAVFSVLRAKSLHIRKDLRSLLEFESGSNDPMAILLTITVIAYATGSLGSAWEIPVFFIKQMGLGLVGGLLFGRGLVLLLNRVHFAYDGIYPVVGIAWAFLTFGLTDAVGGSGFLAAYVAGITASHGNMVHKRSLLRFFDGMAWLAQIALFLVLGLLVTPLELPFIVPQGLLIAAFLIFIARPLAVFLGLSFSKTSLAEKAFVSWVGLRGAAPIILATFPVLAGVSGSNQMFNLVFLVVFASAVVQGWSLPAAARLLKVTITPEAEHKSPLKFAPPAGTETELMEFVVPLGCQVAGKPVVDLKLPEDSLVVLIMRGDQFLVPGGRTVIEEQDTVQVLAGSQGLARVKEIFSKMKATRQDE
jgi:cell volume regulation protein A